MAMTVSSSEDMEVKVQIKCVGLVLVLNINNSGGVSAFDFVNYVSCLIMLRNKISFIIIWADDLCLLSRLKYLHECNGL